MDNAPLDGSTRDIGKCRWSPITRSLRRRAANKSAFLIIFAAFAFGATNVHAKDTVSLAGTFNNWATQGNEWRMEQVDDTTYRFGRFWHAGRYEFKFAFNGSWDRHLGSAGGNQLGMPGQNIELRIGETGYYEITLDTKSKTWRLKQTAPRHLTPVLRIRRESLDAYILDASDSLAPPGGSEKPTYTFSATRLGDPTGAANATLTPIDPQRTRLSIRKEGDYAVTITMTMPPHSPRRAVIHQHLGDGYQLTVAGGRGQRLYPLGNGRWAAALNPIEDDAAVALTSLSRASALPVTIPEGLRDKRVLIVANERTGDIAIEKDGWHEFVFDPKKAGLPRGTNVESVNVVGDFNGWKTGVNPLRLDADGHYRTIVEIAEGIHHYKFLINGSIYLEDKKGDKRYRASDGNGGYNSGLLIGDDAATFGEAKTNNINAAALKHDPTSTTYFAPIAADVARISLRTLANDAQGVALQVVGANPIPLTKSDSRYGFDFWTTQLPTGKTGTLSYDFLINDGSASILFGESGATAADESSSKPYPFSHAIPLQTDTPDWAKQAVWYQIFPERFRNGDKSNDPPRTVPWTHKWEANYKPGADVVKGSPQDFEEKGTFFRFIFDRRYGGDLQGVREKLPYLRDLGVTAIYLNPVFQAESLHKYDASDYRHIDDHFGVAGSLKKIKGETTDPATWQWSDSDKVFLDFIADAHRMGFKVIIDGVFNHVGRNFWAFQDVLKNGKNSEYAGWFEIKSFKPFHYEAWDQEDGSLPKLKHDAALGLAEPVREHLFAVTRRWMDPNGDGDPSDGIDGWRLDVASDVNANFWRDWRKVVKQTNPNAYIVAELWRESRSWLDGQTFDAVMNYPFARRTLRFVINDKKASSPTQFKREIDELHGWYRPQVNYVLQNLYDSHDTDRVASMCMNPDLEYDEANRVQDNGPNYNTSKPTPACYQKQKLLATIQMTFLGAPMVYYGDEVGMYGADDPSDRKPMLWADLMPYDDPNERIETDVLDRYRRLIAIRNTYPAICLGDYQPVMTDDAKRMFAFTRTLGDRTILVVINNSDSNRRLDVPVNWPDGALVVQLDDPNQCELVVPPTDDPTARPKVRPLGKRSSSNLKVEAGRLRGKMLSPRSGAVITIVGNPATQ